MNATGKFYLGLGIALALIVAVAFFIGFRVGSGSAMHHLHAAAVHARP
ncbi:MAG: hypothetical protein GIX03_14120 [Candidatus Eremiobacteraeota bacterium]|nr:hypothetical protein [Candidatus Eremiobacteraeota bacterium]MBC5804104.1 hypothetical protein [Candidatus Eremiobacteraeota bacterium]MBC5820756.1 hypothetical protein [Candidatus Eremiobacteraeota bacterium]